MIRNCRYFSALLRMPKLRGSMLHGRRLEMSSTETCISSNKHREEMQKEMKRNQEKTQDAKLRLTTVKNSAKPIDEILRDVRCNDEMSVNEILDNQVRKPQECDWYKLSTLLSGYDPYARNWTGRVMQILSKDDMPFRVSKAMSLMKYIRETGTPSVTDLFFLIRSLGMEGFGSEHEKTICELYDELKNITDIFEKVSGDAVIAGLSRTYRWRECLPILSDIEMFSASWHACSYVAEAAFHYGDPETGYRLLEKVENSMTDNKRTDDIYLKVFNDVENIFSDQQVLNMLNFMKEHQVIPSETVAKAIGHVFCRDGSHAQTETWAKHNGRCRHCGNILEKPDVLTAVQFEQLKNVYREKAMVRNDVFLGSTPEEVQRFTEFMQHSPKIDIVIDALNFRSLESQRIKMDPVKRSHTVLAGVQYWKEQGLNVMVITRTHLHKGSARNVWSKIEKMASCFTVQNKSKDDPFMVYAAMLNGPGTFIVTKDELRDHLHLMETNEMKRNFRVWQRQHQIYPLSLQKTEKSNHFRFTVQNPPVYGVHVQQGDNGGWHIPFEDGYNRPSFQLPNSWLCIERRS